MPTDAASTSSVPRPAWHRRRSVRLLAILGATFGLWFAFALPDPLFQPAHSPMLLARDGTLLATRVAADGQWRLPLGAAVPERFAIALTRYEDRRFWRHPGVDPLAVARALRANLLAGRVVSGASTLSMQVVRLSRGDRPRTHAEKLLEMLLALRLELRHDKPTILRLYAQHAPFGGNLVGLESAAWRYYGRPPVALSWAEAAALAVLPNSPALVHPGRGREVLRARRDRLLRALHADGQLGALDLRVALSEPLPAAPTAPPRAAQHLLDSLVAAGQGPRLETTLDARLQLELGATLARHAVGLAEHGVHDVAAVVLDNRDGRTLAYLGNAALGGGRGAPMLDIVPRPRSSGSILKPLLYAVMLQDGRLLPSTLVPDIPTRIDGYQPENFDREHRGAVRAADALALSLNVPAVRLLRDYGVERFHAALQGMGFSHLTRPADHYGLTLVLGGAESSLWDVAGAYANLARQAQGLDPDRLAQRWRTLETGPDIPGPALEYGSGAAFLTVQALAEVNRPGIETHWRNFASSRTVAWKTGTSFGLRDAWAVATTPAYTVAVWAGNADGAGVAGLSGTTTAAPVLFALLDQLPDSGWFAPPLVDLQQVEVCSADGYLPREGCPTVLDWRPRGAHFERASPYHQRIHLDRGGRYRVDSSCESVAAIRSATWFVLPPAMEYFYMRRQPGYRSLPRWRADCAAGRVGETPIGLIYPGEGAELFIPVELGGDRGRVVLEAVHRRAEATLYWHLDDRVLGTTREFHQMEVDLPAGQYRLTLVDDQGERLSRSFRVLARER